MGKKLFDIAVFNPPYQENQETTSDKPLYPFFLDAAYNLADIVETITPGRFLFNAGKTKKEWNEKMLNDEHNKVVQYEQDSSKVFSNTDIKGGVAIVLHDNKNKIGPIGTFMLFNEMYTIKDKVTNDLQNGNLSDIMYQQNRFNLDELYRAHPEVKQYISGNGKEQRIISNYFNQMNNIVFFSQKQSMDDIAVLGVVNNNQREFKYIKNKFIRDNGILYKYKVLVPFANGSGAIGEVLSTPLIGTPLIGYTKSFIGVGCFDYEYEAISVLKYIKTKFVRCLLGMKKTTQGNSPQTWVFVPLQDFTSSSDIDWSKSIHEIDLQLYKKYGLSDEEITFIEEKVKEME